MLMLKEGTAMLKREDLEMMNWYVGDDGESFWPVDQADVIPYTRPEATLQAASPKLALVCLEVLALLSVGAPRVTPRAECDVDAANDIQAAYDRLPDKLRATLAAAGVEEER